MMASNARRILINILATYGRSIVSFVFSLFTARWILRALGQSDFGLYGLVGGVMFFISIVNSTQSATVARFYAFSIGGAGFENNGDLTKWFNSSMAIHVVLPLVLVIIGYPIGVYALGHWLNIPPDRVDACVWVFRFSVVSFFLSSLTVPYSAMFVAMQLISQLVLFSFVQVFGLVVISYCLLFVSTDRLVAYSGMLFVMNAIVYFLQVYYAHKQFPSCRVKGSMLFNMRRIGQLLGFTGLKSLGDIAWGIKSNGSAFVVNLQYGPVANAAFSVANQLSTQAETFCRTLANAFTPAITTEEGAGNRGRMIDLSLNCCKFGTLLLLIFVIPLLMEVDYWLDLWLGGPPNGSGPLCRCMLISGVMTYLTKGHQLAIQANGKIAMWQIFDSLAYVSTIPIAVLFVSLGFSLISIGYAYVVSMILICAMRLAFARKLIAMSIRRWVIEVFVPICIVAAISASFSFGVSMIMERGFMRLVVVTGVAMVTTMICAWLMVFGMAERAFVVERLKRITRGKR